MNHTETLLNKNTSNERKILIANEIINTYNLDLNAEQILCAHKNICEKIKGPHLKINRIILLNKLLSINTCMYTATIIALCSGCNPVSMSCLMELEQGKCINLGYSCYYQGDNYNFYCELLNYYEFDVSNISSIPIEDKYRIEEYRRNKYSGKLTKKAIKND